MSPEALSHLHQSDPRFSELINKIGPLNFEPRAKQSPFESLVQAVAHQQLHGKAAATILKRFVALFEEIRPGKKFPKPADLAEVTDEQIRGAGFSRAKVAAIRDIAAKTLEGIVPTARQIIKLDDEEIVERLTAVRGVGRWTVEMLLIFQLGRPNVLPADDFGVRNGFRLTFGLSEMPTSKTVTQFGEIWRPFRTTASLYLWRAADFDKTTGQK